ncbi:(2Fe-2S)-binding protein [Psychromicrobium lacuslunae]|uniref:(2Fe-2S)-binding protein n=1 Tax=Psychromicrobium lacuslunae TaxID=1618207 RepID=UPI0009E3AC96|nr:(2Fe-2S)-binding protein [Psychromicrobium lacuslunae]
MTLNFDGREIPFKPGESVAAALYRSGVKSWRITRENGRPRGLFCGIGVCFDCLITVDGERNQRACLVSAQEGLTLSSDSSLTAQTNCAQTNSTQPNSAQHAEQTEFEGEL